jgi:hypothetical protein
VRPKTPGKKPEPPLPPPIAVSDDHWATTTGATGNPPTNWPGEAHPGLTARQAGSTPANLGTRQRRYPTRAAGLRC